MNEVAIGKLHLLVLGTQASSNPFDYIKAMSEISALVDEIINTDYAPTWDMNNKALQIARDGAQTDGAHHKLWCIDQMVRALTGDAYDDWVAEYEEDGTYEWDTGIAP